MKAKPIYVELPIEAPLEEVWQATQEPERHQQWDLRFSSISYLPKKKVSHSPSCMRQRLDLG